MAVLALSGFAVVPVIAQRLIIGFDAEHAGMPPDGFFFSATRQADPGQWTVLGNGSGRYLSHAADPSVTMRGISVASFSYNVPADVRVSGRIKTIDTDRAGGLVWRYKDANNFYYMGVFNRVHTAFVTRVTEGNRVTLVTVTDVDLDDEEWHRLNIVHDGEEIRGSINGIGILRAKDNAHRDGNRAGVWSAGNSTMWFDDLLIERVAE